MSAGAVCALASVAAFLSLPSRSLAQRLEIPNGPYQFSMPADSLGVAQPVFIGIGVTGNQPLQIPFKYIGISAVEGAPDFVVVARLAVLRQRTYRSP